jgi:hypothetical protein
MPTKSELSGLKPILMMAFAASKAAARSSPSPKRMQAVRQLLEA